MIPYIERTRTYYGTLGYPAYQWAEFDDVPFTPLNRPVAESRLALITTAAPYREELGDQGPGAAYNASAKFFTVYTTPVNPPPNLRISHLGYDRRHTSAADINTWLPVARLNEAVVVGAEKVLALCPCCEFQLRVSADKKEVPIEVVDLAHFASAALGYEFPPEVLGMAAIILQ